MAEEEQEDGANEESGGNKKKLIIVAGISLVLIILSVAGTMFALDMFSGAEDEMLDAELIEAPVDEKELENRPAIYYPIKPPIIVNFQARGRQRFLQAELTLMTRDDATVQAIETHMPMIRNGLVMLFGGQVYEELQTAEGKDLLRQLALEEIQRMLEREIGKPGVEQVLFTNFVMQ